MAASFSTMVKQGTVAAVQRALDGGADPNGIVGGGAAGGKTVLMLACEAGRLDVARLLVERGAAIDARSDFGNTPLMYAAGSGNEELMRYLVSHGADIHEADNYGYTVTLMAARSGSLECLRFCADQGASLTAGAYHDLTPLIVAGSAAVGRFLVEEAGADVNARGTTGFTALMNAAIRGDRALAECLIEQGARLDDREDDVTGSFGKTALHYAAEHGHEDLVRYLVTRGADVTIAAKYGERALAFAVDGGHVAVIDVLVDAAPDGRAALLDALLEAAGRGKDDVVRHLVGLRGAPVNGADAQGVTPLMRAAGAERPTIVQYLLDRGADRGARDAGGRTAADYVTPEPPEEHENAYEAWCHSYAGEVLALLEGRS